MVQFRLDGTRSLTHPENHRRQNENRDQTYDGLEQFLRLLREFRAQKLQDSTNSQRHGERQQDADPDNRHPCATTCLVKITGNDSDDQRSFHAFAKHN